jgi:hypothetical protein
MALSSPIIYPAEAWDSVRAYAEAIETSSAGKVIFAAGFIPTALGSTRRLDEI